MKNSHRDVCEENRWQSVTVLAIKLLAYPHPAIIIQPRHWFPLVQLVELHLITVLPLTRRAGTMR
jgi:hypothetical protein